MQNPLDGRADLRINANPQHPLTRALRKLVQDQGLSGAVLLSFTGGRVGVNSSSPDADFGAAMTALGDLILARFDDGAFDEALLAGQAKGSA